MSLTLQTKRLRHSTLNLSVMFVRAIMCLILVEGYQIHLTEPSVVTFTEYTRGIEINQVPYRESSCYHYPECLFSVNMGPGSYQTSTPPTKIDLGSATCSKKDLSDQILTPYHEVIIDQINITIPYIDADSHTWLTVSAFVSWLPFPGYSDGKDPLIWLTLDGKRLHLNQSRVYHWLEKIPIAPGYHTLTLRARLTDQGAWCSCPSIGNGFVLAHRLCGWHQIESSSSLTTHPVKTSIATDQFLSTNTSTTETELAIDIQRLQQALQASKNDFEQEKVSFEQLPGFLSSKMDFFKMDVVSIGKFLYDLL